jgi:hypothetical protein
MPSNTLTLQPEAPANPYADLMEQEAAGADAQFKASASLAVTANPDKVAQQRRVAGYLGMPPAAVEALPEQSERDAKVKRLAEDTAKAPTLRGKYTDQDFARLAHDDSEVLSGIETVVRRFMDGGVKRFNPQTPDVLTGREYSAAVRRQMELNPALDADAARSLVMQGRTIENQQPLMGESRGPAPSVSSVLSGVFNMERLRARSQGLSVAAADLLGLDNSTALAKYRQATSRAELANPEFETSTGRGLYGGAVSLVDNTPGIVLSVMTGSPALGLALAGGQTSAGAYGKYRERGGTAGEAAVGAVAEGAIEVATEALPMGLLVKSFGRGGKDAALNFMRSQFHDQWTEQIATAAQDAVDTAIANPDKTWGEYFAERPEAAYQTFLATLVQTGALSAAHVATRKLLPERAMAERAEAAATNLEQLGELMAQSKLRERAPESFNQFMAQIAESGQTPTELYIDAEVLANTLNQSGIDIETLRQVAPSAVAQLEAHVPGADVRVPVAEFAAAGPEITTALLDHLRDAPDAMSRAEAKEYLKTEGDKIRTEVETHLAERGDAEAFKAQVEQATTQFEGQLNAAGKFRPEVNKAYASLLGNFYAVQAARAGTTAQELMQRYELRVTGKDVKGAQRLNQGVPAEDATQAVETLKANGLGRLELVESVADLPESGQRKIQSEGAQGVRGLYDPQTDTTYLVRQNIGSVDEALMVGLHEAFHRGLRKSVGPEVEPVLQLIHDGNERVQEMTARYMEQFGIGQLEAVEEVLADLAGQGEAGNLRGFDQLLALLRQAVAKLAAALGVKVEITDQMLTDLVAGVRRAGMRDEVNPSAIPTSTLTTDDSGMPVIRSADIEISFGVPTDRVEFIPTDDSQQMLNMAMLSPEGDYLGAIDLLFMDGKPVALYDIEVNDRKQGVGVRAVEAILGLDPGATLHISNIVPSAQGFWEKLGIGVQNVEEGAAYDGQITQESYLASPAGQKRSRAQGLGGQNQGAGGSSQGNQLDQDQRGALTFGDDITASPSVIALLAGADLSTFVHESGHFFLEVQADLAAKIQTAISSGAEVSEAERAIVADMGRILTWFGVKGDGNVSALDAWVLMPLEQKREHHEQWARGFERYVMEGKAPSQELQVLFARFRAWLVSVYKTLAGLNVELTADVRGVMDRMLASDAAIGDAQAARAMGPLFQTPEQAGMTPEEYADYQALAERATAGASAELDARLMRDMKWLSRARDKAMKARQAEVDELRREAEREVRAEVMAEPIYRAWAFLTGKADKIAPGTVAPENMSELASGKMRSSLVKETNPDAFDRLAELRMVSEKNGLDPDIVAELFGFASGQELVETLKITAKPQAVIEELTDFRMMQEHGDIASKEALDRAADEAVHNELRARVIANELKALAKANKVKETASTGRSTIDVMAQAARQYALQVIARQQIKNLRPAQYAAAEARSAKLAQQSLGDVAEAAMHKRNQLVNNYATKAAYDAHKEVKKGVEFFRKIAAGERDKMSKTRDWGVVQAARAILAEYGVGQKGEAAQSYLKAVADNDPGTYQVLRDKVDALTMNAKPLNQLTVEEFRGLEEEIQSLWYLAKRSRQMEVDGNLLDLEDVKTPLVERMEEIGIPDRVPGEGQAVTDAERRVVKLQTARAALRRVESWVGVKDGQDMGPFRRFIWQPIKEAADAYRADKATYLKRYRALLQNLDVGRERIDAPELGYVFGFSRGGSGKAEILHALLHTGNNSNKRKLLLGRAWATESAEGVLDTSRWDRFLARMVAEGKLGKADFDFAQGVWDLLEDMKPLAQKAHRDVFGRYFDEVTADPFTNQFGSYRGGYVPAMMDSEVVKDAATRALQEDENQTLAYAFPSTNKGFTKARVENNKPLLLDLRSLSQHMDKVLLFSHMEQPIRDVRKVLTSKAVSMPLHRIDPVAFDGLLTPWMNRAARQTVETKMPGDNGLMRFFSKARSRAGMAAMFANVVNTAQQITGLSIAAVKVKPRHLVDAMAHYVRAPRQTARAVADASSYMATRMDNEVAMMNDAIDAILLNPSVYEQAQAWTAKHAYFMQSAVDNVIGPIVWTGAYNQALEAGHPEQDARRLADATVRETQGSTLPEDVSRIETGNAFVRMFTQFAGYFNMQANTLGTEFAKTYHEVGLRKGMGRGLYVFTLGFLVPAMVSEMIVQAARGGPGDEDKDGSTLDDWLLAVLVMGNVRAALGMAPGAGQAANAAINAWNKKPYDDRISTSPAVSMIESAVSAPHSVYKAIVEDGSARKAVRDLATLISMTTGLPANAVARPAGYLADVAQDKVNPTSAADAVRGVVTGAASPDSK